VGRICTLTCGVSEHFRACLSTRVQLTRGLYRRKLNPLVTIGRVRTYSNWVSYNLHSKHTLYSFIDDASLREEAATVPTRSNIVKMKFSKDIGNAVRGSMLSGVQHLLVSLTKFVVASNEANHQ